MHRLLLIANPSARGFTGAALREITAHLSHHFSVDQEWPEGPEESRLAAAKAATASYDIVAAMGGDGVAHHVANGLVGTETALAVIPAGTTNVLGRLLGMPKRLSKLGAGLRRWEPMSLHIVAVHADDREPFWATFAVGLGYDAAVIARAERQPHSKTTWGPLHYARSAVAELRGHSVPTIRATAHGRRGDGAAVSVQVQRHYTYLGRIPFRFGGTAEHGFNVLMLSRVGAGAVTTVAAMAANRLTSVRGDAAVWTDVTSMTATAEPPTPLQADGEPYGLVRELRVEMSDRRLLVIAPPPVR
jgi:diacylglycerol kinase family enzyme